MLCTKDYGKLPSYGAYADKMTFLTLSHYYSIQNEYHASDLCAPVFTTFCVHLPMSYIFLVVSN